MKKFVRAAAGLILVVLAACAFLTVLVSAFLVVALLIAWRQEGNLQSMDIQLLKRGVEVFLIAGAGLWLTWWTAHRSFKEKILWSSKHDSSSSYEREELAMNISTAATFAVIALLIFQRTSGSEWWRLFAAIGWILPIFLASHLRVLLHELGHLLAAQLLGMRKLKIQVGAGSLLLGRITRSGLRWEWRLWPKAGFVYADHAEKPGFKWRQMIFVAGGPIVDGLLIWLSYLLITRHFGSLLGAFMENALGVAAVTFFWLLIASAISGLIPHRVRFGILGIYTDGYWLFHLLLRSEEKAQAFVRQKRFEELNELAKKARAYWEASVRNPA